MGYAQKQSVAACVLADLFKCVFNDVIATMLCMNDCQSYVVQPYNCVNMRCIAREHQGPKTGSNRH